MGVFLLTFMTDDGFMVLDEGHVATCEHTMDLVNVLNTWLEHNKDCIKPIDSTYLSSINDIVEFIQLTDVVDA
jgi:hypothetical protein